MTTVGTPAAIASRAESLHEGAGTNTHDAFAPVLSTASATERETGSALRHYLPVPLAEPGRGYQARAPQHVPRGLLVQALDPRDDGQESFPGLHPLGHDI